jgi:hypothetical protein
MSDTVYSEGLAEEQSVANDLCVKHTEKLSVRGITAERLTTYAASVKDMEGKRAAVSEAQVAQENLSNQETIKRTALLGSIGSINNAVKKKYPVGNPIRKRFHIGDVHGNSTTVIVGWGRDIVKAYPDYKTELAEQGVLQADIDALAADADALEKLNAEQEAAKKLVPDAIKAFNASMDAVEVLADVIQTAAALEFKNDTQTLAKFTAAKQLRFEAPSRKTKQDSTTAAATTTSAGASTTSAASSSSSSATAQTPSAVS